MRVSARGLVESLRDAAWFDAQRARAYLIILAAMSALCVAGYLVLSHPPLDPLGKVLGTDFASFWTASKLALAGHPADAWSIDVHRSAQSAMFGPKAGYAGFFYPPTFLLVCLPLALLPYAASLAIWLIVTGAAWVAMVRAWLGESDLLLILAFPAVLVNAGHGQNGFLTAALFGAGALLCDRRPWLAGALFGLLVVKPHLAVLVPIFFIVSGNWRGFIAAGVIAAGLGLVSLMVFGPAAWQGFLGVSDLARLVLEQDGVGYAKMQSVFAAVRLLGAPVALAWAAQAVMALVAVFMVWRLRRLSQGLANGAGLVCATLLTTPFLLDYDLTLLAVPLAWLFVQARRGGFLPWERLILLAGFMLPVVSRTLATALHLPLAPLAIFALLLCILRRAKLEAAPQSS